MRLRKITRKDLVFLLNSKMNLNCKMYACIIKIHINTQGFKSLFISSFTSESIFLFEPRYEKTVFLHMRKQRRRSAVW